MVTGDTTRDRVWSFIQDHMEANGGLSPTVREIAAAVGRSSTNTISFHLDELVDLELIERKPSVPRGISIVGAIYVTPRQIQQIAEAEGWRDLERMEALEQTIATTENRLAAVEQQAGDIVRANQTLAGALREITKAAEEAINVAMRYGFDPNGSLGLADWLQFALGELSLDYAPAYVSA